MNKKVSFKMPPLGKQYAKQTMTKGINNVKNPVTRDEATQKITELINKSKIPPSKFVEIGTLAENAINNPKQYQQYVDFMVKNKLETAEAIKKPDYQMLASMVVIGKVAETLPDAKPQTEKTEQVMEEISGPVAPTEEL